MGASHGDFTKFPRMPHLFGSKGTDDDKHLGEAESERFISDQSLIVEEKISAPEVLPLRLRPRFFLKVLSNRCF